MAVRTAYAGSEAHDFHSSLMDHHVFTSPAGGYSFDLGIEFQYPVLTWGRSEGDIFEC